MGETDVKSMSAEALRGFMADRSEADYVLVDVRQPAEYSAGHIPGALFLPLLELEQKLFDLPGDRDLVFYCHSGGRSLAAASLAAEAEVTSGQVYNLQGGILGWEGRKLSDFPRVYVFDKTAGLFDLLYTAMDLEKGAWRFYRAGLSQTAGQAVSATMAKLSEAETAHARAVYRHWAPLQKAPLGFDELFDSLPGDILEGGEALEKVLSLLASQSGDICMDLVELALQIEYSAYDLYRTVAENSQEQEAKKVFLSIAQAEKSHMRMLTRAIEFCEDMKAH